MRTGRKKTLQHWKHLGGAGLYSWRKQLQEIRLVVGTGKKKSVCYLTLTVGKYHTNQVRIIIQNTKCTHCGQREGPACVYDVYRCAEDCIHHISPICSVAVAACRRKACTFQQKCSIGNVNISWQTTEKPLTHTDINIPWLITERNQITETRSPKSFYGTDFSIWRRNWHNEGLKTSFCNGDSTLFLALFSATLFLSLPLHEHSMDTELAPLPSTPRPITLHPLPHPGGASQSSHNNEKHITDNWFHSKNNPVWRSMRTH